MKKLILPVFLICACNTYGQITKTETKLTSIVKADLGLQGLGITYEPRLTNSLTTDLSFGVGGSYSVAQNYLEYDFTKPSLYFSATPKYFYNINRRVAKGKNVLNNSGNYIGIRVKTSLPVFVKSDAVRNTFFINGHWGLQRCISNTLTLSTQIGAGYSRDIKNGSGTIYPSLDFKFSYVFFKKK